MDIFVMKNVLSGDSYVYDVEVTSDDDESSVRFHCDSEKNADRLVAYLNDIDNGIVGTNL